MVYQVDKMVLYSNLGMKHYINEQIGGFATSCTRILVIFAQIRLFVFEALQGFINLNLKGK